MSFMQPEIVHGLWLRVDTMSGTWFVPEDLVGPVFLKQDVLYEVEWDNLEPDSKLRALVNDLEDFIEADRTEIFELPIFHWMASSSCSSSGNTPVIHSTTASQATQDRLRSTTRTNCEVGKLARNTRTVSRMTASDTSTGTMM